MIEEIDMDALEICIRSNPELEDSLKSMPIKQLPMLKLPNFDLLEYAVISQIPIKIYNGDSWRLIDDLRFVDKTFYKKWAPLFKSYAENELISQVNEAEQVLYSLDFLRTRTELKIKSKDNLLLRTYNLMHYQKPKETEAFVEFLRLTSRE